MNSKVSSLKRHVKSGKIFFTDTKLVVKSASEKIVIGRIFNDDFLQLDKEAVDLCNQLGLQYDKNLLNEEETEQRQESNEEEETEQRQESNEEEETEQRQESNEEETQEKPKCEQTKEETVGFLDILKINFKNIENSYKKYEKEINSKITLLETELDTTKKELQEVKKKLKGVLIAMQSSLE